MNSNGIEIERKYIIRKPRIDDLRLMDEYSESRITQIYLASEDGKTRRIRRREYDGRVEYTETEKVRIDAMSAFERERGLTEAEFEALSRDIDKESRPLYKKRYTFSYLGQLFEIDEYPEWSDTCIMETELLSREESAPMPDFIVIISEVTGERSYSNAAMARLFPKEISE